MKPRDNATAAVGAGLLMRVADDAPEKVAAALCRGAAASIYIYLYRGSTQYSTGTALLPRYCTTVQYRR